MMEFFNRRFSLHRNINSVYFVIFSWIVLLQTVLGEYCMGPCGYNKYCCGHNQCCRYSSYRVWSLWYFWFIILVLFLISIIFCAYYRKRRFLQQQQVQSSGVVVYTAGADTVHNLPGVYPQTYGNPTMVPPSYQDAVKTGPPAYVAGGYPMIQPMYPVDSRVPPNVYAPSPGYPPQPRQMGWN